MEGQEGVNEVIDSVSDDGASKADLKRGKRVRVTPRRIEAATIDRLPPHLPEAEQGVLGCALLAPNECISELVEKFSKAGSEVFYDLRHQTIYESMIEMLERQEQIDVITLQAWMKKKKVLEQCGGIAYLSALPDVVPSAANLSYYAAIVLEKYTLRKIINTCTDIVGDIYDWSGPVEELVDEIERDIMAIRPTTDSTEASPAGDLINKTIQTIEDYLARAGALTGLTTGFRDLDRMTGGLQNGDMIVIAARPSIGKTSLAMNIADTVAIDFNIPVGVFSLEMTKAALMLRLVASRARVNLRSISEGFLSDRDFPKLTASAGRIKRAPLYIDDTSGLSILELRAKARRMVQKWSVKLFVIDYMQLMTSTSKRARDNRQQEVAEISNGIKAMAKELNVPVIVLTQLNRDLEKDKNRKPRMSDLRESGSIEQDADFVGLLYKANPKDDEDETEELDAVAVNLLIAKQRNGPTGIVHLTFLKNYTRFENAAKVSDDELPN